MQPGKFITFDLETWVGEDMTMIRHKSKILSICIDPLKLHESKCTVEINGEAYGIPFSEGKEIFPATGEQLILF